MASNQDEVDKRKLSKKDCMESVKHGQIIERLKSQKLVWNRVQDRQQWSVVINLRPGFLLEAAAVVTLTILVTTFVVVSRDRHRFLSRRGLGQVKGPIC